MPKKIQNVTQKIIDAAVCIYREEGFEKISIRKIANVSGLAIGTVYNCFEDKDELLAQVLALDIEKLHIMIMEAVFGKSPAEALFTLIYTFIERMMLQSNTIIKFVNNLKPNEDCTQKILLGACKSINELIQQIIEKVYDEQGLKTTEYSAEFIADLTLSMLQTAARSSLGSAGEKARVIYDMILSYANKSNDIVKEMNFMTTAINSIELSEPTSNSTKSKMFQLL